MESTIDTTAGVAHPTTAPPACRDPRGTYPDCPLCGSVDGWLPEHAHFRCRACGFRDSCCD